MPPASSHRLQAASRDNGQPSGWLPCRATGHAKALRPHSRPAITDLGTAQRHQGPQLTAWQGQTWPLAPAAGPSPTPAPGSVPHPWEPAFAWQLPHHTGPQPGCRVSLFPLSPVVLGSSRLTSPPQPHRCFPFLSGGGSERPWPLGYFPHSHLLPAGLLPPCVTLLSG